MKQDFLVLADLSVTQRTELLRRAHELKSRRARGEVDTTMRGKTLALLFEKPSTRTKLSFEAAMTQLGGGTISISAADSQLSRGETLSDTAKVVSRYADAIVFRTFGEARLRELAAAATVPVINGLSDRAHPLQLLADMMTIEEKSGQIAGKTVAFVGDGLSNMALSWIEAAGLFDFSLRIGAPGAFSPKVESETTEGSLSDMASVTLFDSAEEAVRGADVVATDVWTSMGQEKESTERQRLLMPYQVNAPLVALAAPQAIVLHCLPAHRGEEITDDVVDGPQSVVLDEAENRMHAQKALLEILIPQKSDQK